MKYTVGELYLETVVPSTTIHDHVGGVRVYGVYWWFATLI